jgi:hypothetical protein
VKLAGAPGTAPRASRARCARLRSAPRARRRGCCGARLALACALAGLPAATARGGEAELENAPAPQTSEEIRGPLGGAFEERRRALPRLPGLSQLLQRLPLPRVIRDSELTAHFRTYAFLQDDEEGEEHEAWAVGGWVNYHSRWFEDALAVEATWFTSQRVWAPRDKDGTRLLAPGQKGFSVLGVANGKLRYRDHQVVFYRQQLEVPYLNSQDNRMTPNTFAAATFEGSRGGLQYGGGYVWKIKTRDSDEFVSMSKAAGVDGESRGLWTLGLRWRPVEQLDLGVFDQYTKDVFNNFYAGAGYDLRPDAEIGLKLEGQVTWQRSVGDALLEGPGFDAWNVGLRGSLSWRGLVGKLGYVQTGRDRAIRSPYGANPSYVNLMQRDFVAAREKALLLSLSYHFAKLGAEGLSAIANFAQGWDARDGDGSRIGRRQEIDVTLDYRRPGGALEGLWLRLRGSFLHQQGAPSNGVEFRAILNYEFPVL